MCFVCLFIVYFNDKYTLQYYILHSYQTNTTTTKVIQIKYGVGLPTNSIRLLPVVSLRDMCPYFSFLQTDTFAYKCQMQCTSLCFRCLSGSLLHPPPPHRHPTLLLGAGCGSDDPAWEHRGLELHLSQSGRYRDVQSNSEGGERHSFPYS